MPIQKQRKKNLETFMNQIHEQLLKDCEKMTLKLNAMEKQK